MSDGGGNRGNHAWSIGEEEREMLLLCAAEGFVLKASVVDAELEKLGLELPTVLGAMRMVWPAAYDAGETVGASLTINPGIRGS